MVAFIRRYEKEEMRREKEAAAKGSNDVISGFGWLPFFLPSFDSLCPRSLLSTIESIRSNYQ